MTMDYKSIHRIPLSNKAEVTQNEGYVLTSDIYQKKGLTLNQKDPYADLEILDANANMQDVKKNITKFSSNIKKNFELKTFHDKYHNIIKTTTSPVLKAKYAKLSITSLIESIQKYFKENKGDEIDDDDEETGMETFFDEIISENIELEKYLGKIKKNSQKSYQDIFHDDYNFLGIKVDDTMSHDEKYLENEKAEKDAYLATKKKIDDLLKDRDNQLSELGISNNISNNISNSVEECFGINQELNEESSDDMIEISSYKTIFNKYDIKSDIFSVIVGYNSYQKELNITNNKLSEIKSNIKKFTDIVEEQINWLDSVPAIMDVDSIRQIIYQNIRNSFDKEDIVDLFREYKKTLTKLLLLTTFAPKEFGSKKTCTVCLTNELNIVLIPCGHTCCKECSEMLNECMICRSAITTKQKFYT